MSDYAVTPFDRQEAAAGFNPHPVLTFSDAGDYCDDIATIRDHVARAREIFAEQGYRVPDKIIADGRIHRFSPSGERRDDAGTYVLHLDGWPCLLIWNHRLGSCDKFPLSNKNPNAAQQEKIRKQIAAEKAGREEEDARRHAQAAAKAEHIWNDATPAGAAHPYLVKKGVKSHGLREHEGRLVVPMYRNDKLVGLEYISGDGKKVYLPGTEKKGACYVIGDMTGDLALCEGWATGASIHEATGKACVVAFDASNLLLIAKEFDGYPGGEIIVCADDDHKRTNEKTGEPENIGIIKATEAAGLISAKLAVPVFGDNRGEKDTDFDDMARLSGLEAVRECIAKAAYARGKAAAEGSTKATESVEIDEAEGSKEGDEKTPLPSGFRYAEDGSIEHIVGRQKAEEELIWKFLCSPIEFLASTENVDGKNPGLLLRIRNDSGRWHRLAITRADLVNSDELFRLLMDHGLRFVPSGREAYDLKRLLVAVNAENRALCVSDTGWHGHTFVLPDEIIGQPHGVEIVYQPTRRVNHAYRTGGTFEGWKTDVGGRATGNSRLIFAISSALAGPLLNLAGMDGGGFHFRGPSSTGKSTALHTAGSVWGGGGANGFVRSWRATDNAIEGIAHILNDSFLPLDEMAEVEPKAAFRIAYMLANGQGKGRAGRGGELRPSHEWRTIFVSTGEIGLGAKISEDGRRSTAGQEVRVIDISADAGSGLGLFENLHGFARPSELADALRESARQHYGHAARAFLAEITKDMDRYTLRVRQTVKEISDRICPKDADGQVRRVARRFALVATAGELGISFGILPWPTDAARKAALRCFNDWLQSRGGPQQKEDMDAVECVFGWLHRHSSRFRLWEAPSATIFDCAGYIRDPVKKEERRTFYVFPDTFKSDICAKAGLDPEHIAKVLAKAGYLIRSADGKNTRTVRPQKAGPLRVYAIRTPEDEEEAISLSYDSKAA